MTEYVLRVLLQVAMIFQKYRMLTLLPPLHISLACAAVQILMHLALFDRCGPSLQEASAGGRTFQKSGGPVFAPGITLPHQREACQTDMLSATRAEVRPPSCRDSGTRAVLLPLLRSPAMC